MRDLEAQTDALTPRLRQEGKTVPDLNNCFDVTLRAALRQAEVDRIIAMLEAFSIVVNVQILPAEPPPPPHLDARTIGVPTFSKQWLLLTVFSAALIGMFSRRVASK